MCWQRELYRKAKRKEHSNIVCFFWCFFDMVWNVFISCRFTLHLSVLCQFFWNCPCATALETICYWVCHRTRHGNPFKTHTPKMSSGDELQTHKETQPPSRLHNSWFLTLLPPKMIMSGVLFQPMRCFASKDVSSKMDFDVWAIQNIPRRQNLNQNNISKSHE